MNMIKKKILIWGENDAQMRAIERHIRFHKPLTSYEVSARIEYGHNSLITNDVLRSADIVFYGLFHLYGMRLRAEGIPTLKTRIRRRKMGLVYLCGIKAVAKNPLVWDIVDDIPLDKKLRDLENISDFQKPFKELEDFFAKNIFPVDGHSHIPSKNQ